MSIRDAIKTGLKAAATRTVTHGLKSGLRVGALSGLRESGYIVPGMLNKSMKALGHIRPNSPAVDIDRKLEPMRGISRDFAMNSGLASAIYRRFKTNVVGAGLQVQPAVDKDFLGLTDEQANEWNQNLIREFDMFSNSIESSYTGDASFNELQSLLLLSKLVDGDVFYALPFVEPQSSSWPYETAVRVISADLIRTPDDSYRNQFLEATNAKIRNGIEYNTSGRLVAYWVANHYPDESYILDDKDRYTRVPIYNAIGEQQIFHYLDHERIEQRRGLPMLAPVVEDLKNLTRLSKSELAAALVASFFSVFVRDLSGLGGGLQQFYTPEESMDGGGYGPDAEQESKEDENSWDLEMGHGNIMYLDDQKQIDIAETRQKKDFEPFYNSMAVNVAAVAEIPYEIVRLKFDKSYSSLRGALNEAWKKYKYERSILSSRVCQPVLEAFVTEAVRKGRMKAPRFFDDPIYKKAWCRAKWVGIGMGQIDSLDESKASAIKMTYALSSHQEEYAFTTGGRWEQSAEQQSWEKSKMQELGIEDKLLEVPINTNVESQRSG